VTDEEELARELELVGHELAALGDQVPLAQAALLRVASLRRALAERQSAARRRQWEALRRRLQAVLEQVE
jgi:hypothetical protein